MSQENKSWITETDGAAISGEIHRVLGISHRQAKGMIDARCVTVNGEFVKTHGKRLKTGDEIVVRFDTDTSYNELPRPSRSVDSSVNVLWEDKHLVFVDKPAGLLSVPTEHSDDTSLADALVEHYRQKGVKKPRIYIVHRLDRYTTGIMVFAKTPEALNGLRELFLEHRMQRVYKAILVGELPENSGTLHDKLIERTRKLKMAVVAKRTGASKPQGTKSAVTHYRVIERLPGHTVVELKLETGRRNQIRVQFAERGYPLLGDQIYGSTSTLLDRQALHAELLGLRHPVTDENITVQSELPDDMETALRKLRVRRRVDRAKEGIKGEEGIFKPRATKERVQDRVMRAEKFTGKDSGSDDRTTRNDKRPQTQGKPDGVHRRPRPNEMDRSSDKPRPTRTRFRSDEPAQKTDTPRPRREGRENYSKRTETSRDSRNEHSRDSGRSRPTRFRSDESDHKTDTPKPRREGRESYSKRTETSRDSRNEHSRGSDRNRPTRFRPDESDQKTDSPRPPRERRESYSKRAETSRDSRSEHTRGSDRNRPTRFRPDESDQKSDSPKPRREGHGSYSKRTGNKK